MRQKRRKTVSFEVENETGIESPTVLGGYTFNICYSKEYKAEFNPRFSYENKTFLQ